MRPSEILTDSVIEPEWLVRDMFPRGSMIIIAGEPGAGKSTLMYCLAYAIVSGRPFLGHATRPTSIVYFDEENAYPDFLQYNQWAWAGTGCAPFTQIDPLLRIEHMQLLGGWRDPMESIIKSARPGLIIVDTASSAFSVQDENDNAEASHVIRTLRRLRALAANDTTFIVLKHEKQRLDTTHRRSIRGAKVWLGAFDQVLYHAIASGGRRRKDGTRKTVLEPEKLRAFALRYPIGIDPVFTEDTPKGLILKTYPVRADAASATESAVDT